jgi:hypothetical protein
MEYGLPCENGGISLLDQGSPALHFVVLGNFDVHAQLLAELFGLELFDFCVMFLCTVRVL